jgi:hypothetical protein
MGKEIDMVSPVGGKIAQAHSTCCPTKFSHVQPASVAARCIPISGVT